MSRWPHVFVATLILTGIPVSFVSCQEQTSGAARIRGKNDLPLVERVIAARKQYQESLEALRKHYVKTGEVEKSRWVEEELLSFHRIPKRAYRLDLDVPPPTLRPTDHIPEANELFHRALSYKGKGWGSTADDNMRRAEILLQHLLTNYPTSDKIDDAAFHLGEIYEHRSFRQFRRAAMYYERCYQWNPNTGTDARMRAARLYDRTLDNRSKAIQLYRDVTNFDADPRRVEEARRRLEALGRSSAPP